MPQEFSNKVAVVTGGSRGLIPSSGTRPTNYILSAPIEPTAVLL
jgi:hypothetical protein